MKGDVELKSFMRLQSISIRLKNELMREMIKDVKLEKQHSVYQFIKDNLRRPSIIARLEKDGILVTKK